ncbi:MAG: hypothetical protein K8R53_11815 [Bacteroidales bacterium]|nr:hypothetical protein [Bacteroidales bacterium]
MNKSVLLFTVIAALFVVQIISAQDNLSDSPPPGYELDSRIDNNKYWIKMAELGLAPVNQPVPFAPAIFKRSEIQSPYLAPQDSPDIPVTNLTNTTQTENSIFVDPNDNMHVLNSNNSTSWSGSSVGSLYGANYFYSNDGGNIWGGSVQGAGGDN